MAEQVGIRLERFDEYAPSDYYAARPGRRRRLLARHGQHRHTDLARPGRAQAQGGSRRAGGATVAKARTFGLVMSLTERLIAR